ncbi:putative Uracil-DNA glycosylase-like protein [Seiridium unicorne]|uniref:Uracil-DNA glycosylase-like protein n=1 Tax=Seiridium unicorne TaxID=138068 RepID=A0ABR2VDB6_9PEZI
MTNDRVEETMPILSGSPSFEGRLKLNQFMYANTEKLGTSVRRSPRLSTPLSATLPISRSPSKGASPLPAPSAKRRRESTAETVIQKSTSQTSRTSAPSPRKRNRPSGSYAPPSTYAHLPPLPDVLGPNLLILFIGLNPGIQTARSGHAYAHPSNLFWKLLYSSGITPVPCKAEEDRTLPERFGLGNTNIVERPSRNGAELSKAEMDEGVQILEEKIRTWKPEVVCVVGKSIWESVWRVRKGKAITKAEFRYGWQDESENMGVSDAGEDEEEKFVGARVFVATSTSGLAASLRPEEKERIWKELGDWCKARRIERGNAVSSVQS